MSEVKADPEEVESIANSIGRLCEELMDDIKSISSKIRGASTWQDAKHEEICSDVEQSVGQAIRSLEPIADEIVPRMKKFANKLREAEQA